MPNLVTFEISKKTSSDYFNFDQLEILCNFYEDGTRISANSDINFAEEMKKNN
jgi:hypothetical protein